MYTFLSKDFLTKPFYSLRRKRNGNEWVALHIRVVCVRFMLKGDSIFSCIMFARHLRRSQTTWHNKLTDYDLAMPMKSRVVRSNITVSMLHRRVHNPKIIMSDTMPSANCYLLLFQSTTNHRAQHEYDRGVKWQCCTLQKCTGHVCLDRERMQLRRYLFLYPLLVYDEIRHFHVVSVSMPFNKKFRIFRLHGQRPVARPPIIARASVEFNMMMSVCLFHTFWIFFNQRSHTTRKQSRANPLVFNSNEICSTWKRFWLELMNGQIASGPAMVKKWDKFSRRKKQPKHIKSINSIKKNAPRVRCSLVRCSGVKETRCPWHRANAKCDDINIWIKILMS